MSHADTTVFVQKIGSVLPRRRKRPARTARMSPLVAQDEQP
jgi:hypothetical protein